LGGTGRVLGLGVATLLFIFYIQPDASDLRPIVPSWINCSSAATPFTTICAIWRLSIVRENIPRAIFEAMKTNLENEAALVLAEIDKVTQSQCEAAAWGATGIGGPEHSHEALARSIAALAEWFLQLSGLRKRHETRQW